MRVLITGAKGQLGGALTERLKGNEVLGLDMPDGDVRDKGAVESAVRSFRPDTIIHAAALTWVDYCEEHPQEAADVNVEGTRNVVKAAGDARLVYISTEYVFDGENGPYSEEDKPSPISVYGRTKLEAEKLARTAERWTIVRTTVVFTYRPKSKNFLMQVLEGKPMRVPNDQYSNPTLTENLTDAVVELIDRDMTGIYNVVGADRVDRYAFAQAIANRFGLDGSLLTPVTTKELGQKAPRPLGAGLKIDKAKKELKTRLFSVAEALDFAHGKQRESV